MSDTVDITVLSSDGLLLTSLARQPQPLTDAGQSHNGTLTQWNIDEPQRTPGAAEGWWELAVDIGVMAAPVSVVCNLIASWLWAAFERREQQNAPQSAAPVQDVLLVLRNGDLTAEVRVTSTDPDAARAAILAALTHVHPER